MPSTEALDQKPERRVFDLSTNGNTKAFSETLALMEPGDRIIYHVGIYAAGPHKQQAALAHEQGLVLLFHTRRSHKGMHRFNYIAQRTKKDGMTK